jgi:hypothetical protein
VLEEKTKTKNEKTRLQSLPSAVEPASAKRKRKILINYSTMNLRKIQKCCTGEASKCQEIS